MGRRHFRQYPRVVYNRRELPSDSNRLGGMRIIPRKGAANNEVTFVYSTGYTADSDLDEASIDANIAKGIYTEVTDPARKKFVLEAAAALPRRNGIY